MKTHAQFHRLPLALAVSVPFLLSGCFGGSSSSSSDDPPSTSQLTEEEQVLGAATVGLQRAQTIQDQAEAQTEPRDNPDPGSSGDSSGLSTAAAVPEDPEFTCDEGGYYFKEGGELFQVGDDDFPQAHFSNADSVDGASGDPRDAVIRGDCVSQLDEDSVFSYEGGLNLVQREQMHSSEGRLIWLQVGSLPDGIEGEPDPEGFMEFESGDFGGSRFRMQVFACEGCVDGDLSNFDGDPKLDATSVSFGELDFNLDGFSAQARTGASLDDPFVMQTARVDDSSANVTLDGELQFVDSEQGCGFDVTYATARPLLIENYAGSRPDTVDGEISVTSNESGRTFDVEYHADGEVTITENGSTVTVEPSEEAAGCGFFAPGQEFEGVPTASDLAGTWGRVCEPSEGVWVSEEFTFDESGEGVRDSRFFNNSDCTGEPEGEVEIGFDFAIGFGVPSEVDEVAGVEIDLFNREVISGDDVSVESEVFGAFGIGDNTLYWGDFETEEAQRPGSLEPALEFTRE